MKKKLKTEVDNYEMERQQEIDRELLVDRQSTEITYIILASSNPITLTSELLDLSYKYDAFKISLDSIESALEYRDFRRIVLENVYLEKKIGVIKERPFEYYGDKEGGVNPGELVTKVKQSNDDVNIKKHKNIWLKKEATIGESVCEYIGSNLINHFMQDNSPKVRLSLEEDESEVFILSKYIHNFSALSSFPKEDRAEVISRAKGFTSFFAYNVLIGDYDVNSGNIGIRRDDDLKDYIAKVDNGESLSYNVNRPIPGQSRLSEDISLKSAQNYKTQMLASMPLLYKDTMFSGLDFAGELYSFTHDLNLRMIEKIIELSLDNLQYVYGEDVLQNPEVEGELEVRMRLSPPINAEILKNKIIENIVRLKDNLQEIAVIEMEKIFPMHPNQAI